MTYASSVPTITPLYTGLQNSQSATSTPPTCSTTATSSSPVSGSPYPSTCTGASDPNYAISYLPGTVTIATAQIFVAVSGTQTYGGVPSFSGTDSPPSGVTVGHLRSELRRCRLLHIDRPRPARRLPRLGAPIVQRSHPVGPQCSQLCGRVQAARRETSRSHRPLLTITASNVIANLRRLGPQRRCRVLRPEEPRNRDHHAAYVQYYRHEFEPSRRFSLSVNV